MHSQRNVTHYLLLPSVVPVDGALERDLPDTTLVDPTVFNACRTSAKVVLKDMFESNYHLLEIVSNGTGK